MRKGRIKLLPEVQTIIGKLSIENIPEDRKDILQVLINYIQSKRDQKQVINLNFICTHNSRRSQFSQIWAQTAADYFGIQAYCFSGGVEVTAFNERAVDAIKRVGFQIRSEGTGNPHYKIANSIQSNEIRAFSKVYDDSVNPSKEFAAIMTCSHADENCPFIPGTEKRISVRYEDPKAFDDTKLEAQKYDERSIQIATEMFYVFSNIS